jgi:hypothetical protein
VEDCFVVEAWYWGGFRFHKIDSLSFDGVLLSDGSLDPYGILIIEWLASLHWVSSIEWLAYGRVVFFTEMARFK